MLAEIYYGNIGLGYYVDDEGDVINGNTGEYLSGWIGKRGYRVVSLRINPNEKTPKFKKFPIHQTSNLELHRMVIFASHEILYPI